MIKVSNKLNPKQIKEAFIKLPTKDQLRLIRDFERLTRKDRWGEILKNIDKRRKKHKISMKEIHEEIEKAREEFYARYR